MLGISSSEVSIFGGGEAAGSLVNIEPCRTPADTNPSNNFLIPVEAS